MTMQIRRRTVLAAGFAFAVPGDPAASRSMIFDAVVARPGNNRTPSGRHFTDLQQALAAAPMHGGRPFRIWLARGEWAGQFVVDRPDIHLIGEDRVGTRIRFDAASGMTAPDGRPYGTFRTPVLKVVARGFVARTLTIENGFDGIAEMRKVGARLLSDAPAGPQAVALALVEGSDQAWLDRIDVHSHQDSLFVDTGNTRLTDCLITGSYDFIFGAGSALFDRCELRSRLRPDPAQVTGFIAAPSTLATRPIGLLFHGCRLTRDAGVPQGSVFLGRPWRPSKRFADGRYGDPEAIGMAAYIDCRMDDHIAASGWTEMWYTDKAGDMRHMLQPEEARFCEYGSRGRGSPRADVVRRGRILDPGAAELMLADAHRTIGSRPKAS